MRAKGLASRRGSERVTAVAAHAWKAAPQNREVLGSQTAAQRADSEVGIAACSPDDSLGLSLGALPLSCPWAKHIPRTTTVGKPQQRPACPL